eukprot:1039420-Pleurochrysis_carterae.AAC.1
MVAALRAPQAATPTTVRVVLMVAALSAHQAATPTTARVVLMKVRAPQVLAQRSMPLQAAP